MPITLSHLCNAISPSETSLLLGAGSSIPSGAPSGYDLRDGLIKEFKLTNVDGLTLANVASLVEIDFDRRKLIGFIRSKINNLAPTGAIVNLPLFGWKDIFTTNYDELIEDSFRKAGLEFSTVSSNFDYPKIDKVGTTLIFKIHGTIDKDISDGDRSRIIVSDADYEEVVDFRENLYSRMVNATSRSDVLIIGHSLEDPDLNQVIDASIKQKKNSGSTGKIYALVYSKNESKAKIIERRGIEVCFGGLDQFVEAQTKSTPLEVKSVGVGADPLDVAPELRPVTIEVTHFFNPQFSDAVKLFHGSAASYGDVAAELTFGREIVSRIVSSFELNNKSVATILGPAGFGKSTIARMAISRLSTGGALCWEHKGDSSLNADAWIKVADYLDGGLSRGVLFIDDCHKHLRSIDILLDHVIAKGNVNFIIIVATTKNQWRPRTKSPNFTLRGDLFEVGVLNEIEIGNLLNLLDRKPPIFELVDQQFRGYSRTERARRLRDKCGSDMFVCMKNMFSSDELDDIILADFAELSEPLQEIYKIVSALEAFGVRVHRQTVLRLTGVAADYIDNVIKDLSGVVNEYNIDEKNGIYGWNCRHIVISDIILKYKFSSQEMIFGLMSKFIELMNPSYNIERLNINELCDQERGIGRIFDKEKQNILLRKMISSAPSQKVPRHRLIRNLIKGGDYVPAGNEIRLYKEEFKSDAPISRYQALLFLERAKNSKGIMDEDRIAIADQAVDIITRSVSRFPWDKSLYGTYCDIGFFYLKTSGSWSVLDSALEEFKAAAERYDDPDFARMIAHVELRMKSVISGEESNSRRW